MESQEGTIGFDGGLEVRGVTAAVEGGHVLLTLFDPLYGPAELDGQVGDGDLLREHAAFFAEATADVLGDDADGIFLKVEGLGQEALDPVGPLGGVPKG